ncbi:hypothetical protein [Cognatilysobacter terrigena]|uniref:hypothetical protein n=1 Tax=Cognatilysobacter terrigena TaxID=2488749 RepID=UPI00105FF086|nr:hypothetical protein [Lysobacter terrigena]
MTTFAEMSRDGYRFSLADVTAAELLLQYQDGQTTFEQHLLMVRGLQTFVDQELPVMFGGGDLRALVTSRLDRWKGHEARDASDLAWKAILDPSSPIESDGIPLDHLRSEGRENWPRMLEQVALRAELSGIDIASSDPDSIAEYLAGFVAPAIDGEAPHVLPPLSIRRHLEIRYKFRQAARMKRAKEPYDPYSPRKRNDGLDVDLFDCLMLPAFVVTCDRAFFGGIESIASFQRSWFKRPEALAREWRAGERPAPRWPAV